MLYPTSQESPYDASNAILIVGDQGTPLVVLSPRCVTARYPAIAIAMGEDKVPASPAQTTHWRVARILTETICEPLFLVQTFLEAQVLGNLVCLAEDGARLLGDARGYERYVSPTILAERKDSGQQSPSSEPTVVTRRNFFVTAMDGKLRAYFQTRELSPANVSRLVEELYAQEKSGKRLPPDASRVELLQGLGVMYREAVQLVRWSEETMDAYTHLIRRGIPVSYQDVETIPWSQAMPY